MPRRCSRTICGVTVLVPGDKPDALAEELALLVVDSFLCGAVIGGGLIILLDIMFPLGVSLVSLLVVFIVTLYILRKRL